MFYALQVQTDLYLSLYNNIRPLADLLKINENSTVQDIPADFISQMSNNVVERLAKSITLLDTWREKVWSIFAFI
jgi:hypothetical protein